MRVRECSTWGLLKLPFSFCAINSEVERSETGTVDILFMTHLLGKSSKVFLGCLRKPTNRCSSSFCFEAFWTKLFWVTNVRRIYFLLGARTKIVSASWDGHTYIRGKNIFWILKRVPIRIFVCYLGTLK